MRGNLLTEVYGEENVRKIQELVKILVGEKESTDKKFMSTVIEIAERKLFTENGNSSDLKMSIEQLADYAITKAYKLSSYGLEKIKNLNHRDKRMLQDMKHIIEKVEKQFPDVEPEYHVEDGIAKMNFEGFPKGDINRFVYATVSPTGELEIGGGTKDPMILEVFEKKAFSTLEEFESIVLKYVQKYSQQTSLVIDADPNIAD